jgi:hypothetical protein
VKKIQVISSLGACGVFAALFGCLWIASGVPEAPLNGSTRNGSPGALVLGCLGLPGAAFCVFFACFLEPLSGSKVPCVVAKLPNVYLCDRVWRARGAPEWKHPEWLSGCFGFGVSGVAWGCFLRVFRMFFQRDFTYERSLQIYN